MTPATTSTLRPTIVLLITALVGGSILFARRAAPAIIGAIGTMWLLFVGFVWFVVVKLSWVTSLLPRRLLPSGTTPRLGLGAGLAIGGGLLLVIASVAVLSERTWRWRAWATPVWSAPAAIALLACAVLARDLGWVDVVGPGDVRWRFDLEIVPVIGEILSIASFATAALIIIVALRPRAWLGWALVASGGVIVVYALVAIASGSFVEDVAGDVIDRTGLAAGEASVDMTAGPLVWCVVGAGASIFAWVRTRRASASRHASSVRAPRRIGRAHPRTLSTDHVRGPATRPGAADDGLPTL